MAPALADALLSLASSSLELRRGLLERSNRQQPESSSRSPSEASASGSLRLAATGDRQCEVSEDVHLGFRTPVVGRLLDRLLSYLLAVDHLRRHMCEEGNRLAELFSSDGTI